jgi:hypothetical protein
VLGVILEDHETGCRLIHFGIHRMGLAGICGTSTSWDSAEKPKSSFGMIAIFRFFYKISPNLSNGCFSGETFRLLKPNKNHHG